jgi:hypothetical protein
MKHSFPQPEIIPELEDIPQDEYTSHPLWMGDDGSQKLVEDQIIEMHEMTINENLSKFVQGKNVLNTSYSDSEDFEPEDNKPSKDIVEQEEMKKQEPITLFQPTIKTKMKVRGRYKDN